jgi:CheY-like chemotaxis protein
MRAGATSPDANSTTGAAAVSAAPARPKLRLIELTRDEVEPLGVPDEGPSWLFGPWPETAPAEAPSEVESAQVPAQAPAEAAPESMAEAAPAAAADTEPAPEPFVAPAPAAVLEHVPAAVLEPVVSAPPPAAPPAIEAEAARPRALIAEDSITACIFLERLLQQRGFAVTTVGNARDLRLTLTRERWDLVLVDVDLPDAPGGSGLVGLSPRRAGGAGAEIVALVRDREDSALARAAGVQHVLRKPFEHGDVAHVLTTLGFPGPHVRS